MQTIEIDQHPLLLGMKQVKEDMVIKGGRGRQEKDGCMPYTSTQQAHVRKCYARYGRRSIGITVIEPSPSYRHQYGVAHRYLNYPTRLKSQKAKVQIIANLRRYPYLMGNRHYPQRFVFSDFMPCAHRSTAA